MVGLLCLSLASGAGATAGFVVSHSSTELVIPLQVRGDTIISVSANQHQRVRLRVNSPSSSVEYSTEGNVDNHHIEASFGSLGRVNIAMILFRHPPDPPHTGRCHGRAPVYEEGTYHGVIEFSHWADVPHVSTLDGHILLTHRYRQVCKRRSHARRESGHEKRPDIEAGVLTIHGQESNHTVFLQALIAGLRHNLSRSVGNFTVKVYERRDGVRILKEAITPINHLSFTMSEFGSVPETVNVELPEPFAGYALYSDSNVSSNWTGNLSIHLPGIGNVSLTGPNFNAYLCRIPLAKLSFCLPQVGPHNTR